MWGGESQLLHYSHVDAPKNLRSETWEALEICCPWDRASLLLSLVPKRNITPFTNSHNAKPKPYRSIVSLWARWVCHKANCCPATGINEDNVVNLHPPQWTNTEAPSTTKTPGVVHVILKMTAGIHSILRARLTWGNAISSLLLVPMCSSTVVFTQTS